MNPETHTLQRKMADITSLLSTVVELNQFAQRLVEKDLLSYQSMSSILQTLGYSKLNQAGQLMDAVMAQVRVTPKKFEAFVMILSYDTSLLHLKDDVMKTYSRWRDRLQRCVNLYVTREPRREASLRSVSGGSKYLYGRE